MVITAASEKVLKVLLSDPMEEKNISTIAEEAEINYRQAHDAVEELSKEEVIEVNKKGRSRWCSPNTSGNWPLFAYIEGLRAEDLERRHRSIQVIKEQLKKVESAFFTAMVFGSYANGEENEESDIDLLFILPKGEEGQKLENSIKARLEPLDYPLHPVFLREEEVLEALKSKGGEINVVKEAVRNHILLYGAENYYKILGDMIQ
ncbi:MAG: nucleotidyltransferase domain-containing protein [Candidatus Nanohaloarchaea archaeon]|nr:nucleotidyltransferase domain-containing protein [Candidatus Nanohaloarchaea archaeon]